MKFNNDKFRMLHYELIGGGAIRGRYLSPSGEFVKCELEIKDLGVTMTNDAKFDIQIENTVRKARKMMGWVLRTFRTRDPNSVLILYTRLLCRLTSNIAAKCFAM